MSEWTYHAQDARTEAWISRDLPLSNVEISDVLTGDSQMTASIEPQLLGLGLLEDWGTWIYAEKNDEIRFGGLLTESDPQTGGDGVAVTIIGLTGYANEQTYTEKFRLWDADPLDCYREVWRYLLSFPRSPHNVTVDGDGSPVRISDVQPPDKPVRADVTYPTGSPYGTAGAHWSRPAKPVRLRKKRPVKRKRRAGETDPHWDAYVVIYNRKLDAWKARRQKLYTSRLPQWNAWHSRLAAMRSKWEDDYGDREPYKLSWWEDTDCGAECQRLAQEGDFEWRERHTWTDGTKAAVAHRIQLGYPTVGITHATALTIAGGTLAETPGLQRGGPKYANAVLGVGAGEGRKAVRVLQYVDDGRLRRIVSLAAKSVKRRARLVAKVREELSYRTLLNGIPEITLWDDDGTLGSYRLGDIVPISITEGIAAGVTTSHKIIGRTYRPDEDDRLTLQLVRAERSSA